MSENVDAVERVFEAWNQHDADLLVGQITADCVLDWSNSIGPNRGVYRGRNEVKAFYEGFIDAWEAARWEPLELIAIDDERLLSVNLVSARVAIAEPRPRRAVQ